MRRINKQLASPVIQPASGGSATVITKTLSYDGWDRLTGESVTVGDGTTSGSVSDQVSYSYDAVGRMTGRTLGSGTGATAETLSYDVRDHLTSQSSSVFSSTLYYTDPSRTATTGKYDGSVSEWSWNRGSGTTTQTYAFSYDGLGRLTGTLRYTGNGTTATNAFTEQGLEYDRNGNITKMKRYDSSASSPEDNFAFTLTGNRISSLTNSGTNGSGVTYTAFTYDANGNTTHDGRTGQDISWNMLNLISGISTTSGGNTTQLASYNWYADGTKYSAERPDGSGYVYKGNVIYEKATGGSLSLDCVLTTGGRIVANKNSSGTITGYTVYHHITDHLGSVRAITNASTGTVVETSDYLPFGTRWSQTSGSSSATITDATNRWRYSGKEEQKAINATIPLIDYGARMYDPIIARWMSVDPMAEKYYPMSPYGYCAGNPINILDPNGSDVWEIDELGRVRNRIEDTTTDSFYMVDDNGSRRYITDIEGNKHYISISFKYGTVESQRTIAINSTDTYDTFKVRGDANGTQLFEFMGQYTSVEWSQAKTGLAGDQGLNFLTTSHDADRERGMTDLFRGQLYAGYTIRELNHSHPNNTGYPSGSFVHPYTGLGVGEWGDVGFARRITNNRKVNRLNIPTFNIFLPASESYISFGPDSIRDNYEK
ncbi:MAG: hypothetical protein IJK73_02935 [Bacteroidales bacterium]|nr:hypothetical protein [Bacteroidales bacterium]